MKDPSMDGHYVLIVDDNEANLYLLRALLEGHGCRVATAANGAEALVEARRDPPDLIVSDILMPVMDGFALCREWKKDDLLRPIPFIFYTATYTDERDRQFALSLGAERFVVKPEEPEVLIQIILENLGREGVRPSGRVEPTEDAPSEDDTGYLTLYNRALVRKLESKMRQLEQANLELRESHRNLEEAQRIAHMGSWTLDPTSAGATWSSEMYRILGLDETGPAIPFTDMPAQLSPDGVNLVTAALERAVETGEAWSLELDVVRPDDRRGRVAINGIVDRDDTGAVVRLRRNHAGHHRTERDRRPAAPVAADGGGRSSGRRRGSSPSGRRGCASWGRG